MKKTITHYYCDAAYSRTAKNKLDKEFQEYLISLNGMIVRADQFTKLTLMIRQRVTELNKKHNRCKPIEVRFFSNARSGSKKLEFYTQEFFIRPGYLNTKLPNATQF